MYLGNQDNITFSEAQGRIFRMINAAPDLSFTEKSQLTSGVAQLSAQDVMNLFGSLSGVGGAAVGAIIARYLLNKGLIGTVLGAIFGSSVAQSIFGSRPKNDMGFESMQGYDMTGNRIHL
jgi:hypothetical protein